MYDYCNKDNTCALHRGLETGQGRSRLPSLKWTFRTSDKQQKMTQTCGRIYFSQFMCKHLYMQVGFSQCLLRLQHLSQGWVTKGWHHQSPGRERGREDLRFELCFKRGHPRLSLKHISTAGHFARSLVCLAEICRLDFECRHYSTFIRFENIHLDITLNERAISKVDPAYVSSREFPFESHTK